MSHPLVHEALWNHMLTPRGEGYREDIYVDNAGLPTTGTGLLLRSASDLRAFHWFAPSGRPIETAAVIAAYREYAPVGDRTPSAAGLRARNERGAGCTIMPGFRTNRASIRSAFDARFQLCEDRAKEAVWPDMWLLSPADAQFAIILHLWLGQNALRGTAWPRYHRAIKVRDWETAAEQCTWNGMRPCRREDLQLAFHNASRVEQAHLENTSVSIAILHFPATCPLTPRGQWNGVSMEAVSTAHEHSHGT